MINQQTGLLMLVNLRRTFVKNYYDNEKIAACCEV